MPFATALHALRAAAATGRLGRHGRIEAPDASTLTTLASSIPWGLLLAQGAWTVSVTLFVYFSNATPHTTLSDTLAAPFWHTPVSISGAVVSAVGWGLFVLLAFFIRESSAGYSAARNSFVTLRVSVRQILCLLKQEFAPGRWHPGDIDRIVAHLVAFPIALKMHLRGERDAAQLNGLLDARDVDDVLADPFMYLHCTRVVRAYLSALTDDRARAEATNDRMPGIGARFLLSKAIDDLNQIAVENARIYEFAPSIGYVNHLRVFLYIWLFFLPLNFVSASGWFTLALVLPITYAIAMLFSIAAALNEPFGFDVQDIRLARISAQNAADILSFHSECDFRLTTLVRAHHDTPEWLEDTDSAAVHAVLKVRHLNDEKNVSHRMAAVLMAAVRRVCSWPVFTLLAAFTAWTAVVMYAVYWLDARTGASINNPACRYWCPYIPIPNSVSGDLSLGLFMLLGYWLSDCYGRYWAGLQLWHTGVRTAVDNLANQIPLVTSPGDWHPRDHQRILAHLAAIPYAARDHLRNKREYPDVELMLDEHDYKALVDAPHPVSHLMNVLFAYFSAIDQKDPDTLASGVDNLGCSRFIMCSSMQGLELTLASCEAHRFISLPPAILIHMQCFIALWLALLPLASILHNGPLAFIFLLPIAYSIITLFVIGTELADPYGEDEHDIPLDTICAEIKAEVTQVYRDNEGGQPSVMKNTGYCREAMRPQPITEEDSDRFEFSDVAPSPMQTVRAFLAALPAVPVAPMIIAVVWIVIATFLSRYLSFSWPAAKRNNCRQWCSPIDVDGGTLGNIGFALFMILGFRASDAINRHEHGAKGLYDIEKGVRNLAVEVLTSLKDGFFHEQDKERIVALLSQIPLTMRDVFLGVERTSENRVGLLSEEDWNTMVNHPTPVMFLVRTIEAYMFRLAMGNKGNPVFEENRPFPPPKRLLFMVRIAALRHMVTSAYGVKRFPVVGSYVDHQQLFTGLWVLLLPLSMTPWTGWYTILWSPIICYGVFAMENIAVKLVDPYGDDDIDIPVDELCRKASNAVIEAAWSVNWSFEAPTNVAGVMAKPELGAVVEGMDVKQEHSLAHFEDATAESSRFGTVVHFRSIASKKAESTLYAHLQQSVPWVVLLAVLVYTLLSTCFSYWIRVDSDDQRWWQSRISVSGSVASYLSIAAFSMLGFYVHASYARYSEAGAIWTDSLKSGCHTLATAWMTSFPSTQLSVADQKRLLAHIAALPMAFKQQLRDSRDLRELKGLLSTRDLAELQCAQNMALRCLDVLRAYFYRPSLMVAPDDMSMDTEQRIWAVAVRGEHMKLEGAIATGMFLKEFTLTPGFKVVLNAMLGIWFMVLPFVLAEVSGWLTIVLVPLIAYGLLGMYSVAAELQQPFGTDLNDLDLDEMAEGIMRDVVFVERNARNGMSDLIVESSPELSMHGLHPGEDEMDGGAINADAVMNQPVDESIKLAAHAMSYPLMGGVVLWAFLLAAASLAVNRVWPLPDKVMAHCKPWWCSRLAVDGSVSGYVGFALFLLLGFRLLDSHGRYMRGLRTWVEGLLLQVEMLSNRLFEAFEDGTFHENDVDRIGGHVAAVGVVLVASLREESCDEQLRQIVSDSDARHIKRASSPVYHCIDVVRAYLMEADRQMITKSLKHAVPIEDLFMANRALGTLESLARHCERIVLVPLPFGYVQHLRIFLAIWLGLLPLGLVEATGWVCMVWVVLIAYGVLGIEHWSTELSNPFGYDVSDVPLEMLQARFVRRVRFNRDLLGRGKGSASFVCPDRKAFTQVVEECDDAPVYGGRLVNGGALDYGATKSV